MLVVSFLSRFNPWQTTVKKSTYFMLFLFYLFSHHKVNFHKFVASKQTLANSKTIRYLRLFNEQV